MADVFISYSKADRALVERAEAALNAAGFTTWWDKGLIAGEDFGPTIDRHLAEARAVVCLWTEASTKSQWVRAEAEFTVEDSEGTPVGDGTYTTGADGTFCVQNLIIGDTYTVTETVAPDGHTIDATPQDVIVEESGTCIGREGGPDATFVNPIIALLLGWELLGERLSTQMLVGMGLVIGSVFVAWRLQSRTAGDTGARVAPRTICAS